MTKRSQTNFGALKACFEELLEPHAVEIEARGLAVRLDVDPDFHVSRDESLDQAIRELIRLVLATVPDGCEIFVGAARSTAPVSRVGAGRFTTRWQVMGESGPGVAGPLPTPLHPRPGHAGRHVRSRMGRRAVSAFRKTEWTFSLEVLDGGVELLAIATVD